MYRSVILTLILSAFLAQFVIAQSSPIQESGGVKSFEQAAFNVHFYDLDLRVDPSDSTVAGTVEIHFKAVHPTNMIEIALDPRLGIDHIKDGENSLRFTRTDSTKQVYVYFLQTVQPGEERVVSVTYGGKPQVASNPPWNGGMVWRKTPSGDPWVGVAVQMNGAWLWWPNKDHPSDRPDSVAINITMPDHLVVASNGHSRGETDHEDGWKTWHWFVSTPISNYNVTLNAAPYEIISGPYTSIAGDDFDITFWVLPEYMEQAERLFPQFAEQMRFMEEIAGPYPFRADKYGVAHAPYLGMEHQTIIAYGANFEDDNLFGLNAGFDDLHQHELAHEWWGNLVKAWDWRDFWIHEGFGTYMQALYAEYLSGADAYFEMMELFRSRIHGNTDREVAPREPMSSFEITQGSRGGNVYYKGAWFLHTLRYVIGDENFFEAIRRFAYPTEEMEQVTDGSHMRFATTDDFLNLTEEITGMDLNWLFEIYLRQPRLPVLHASRRGEHVRLGWEAPEGYAFPMPLQVRIDGETMTLVPQGGIISFDVLDFVEVEADPYNWILKDFRLEGAGD